MNAAAEPLQLAASFDWETLIPLVFFVLYGLSQFLGSRKNKEVQPEEAEAEEQDPMERARQIREEIQRRIAERSQSADPADGPVRQPTPVARPAYDPRLPESQQRRAQPQPSAQPVPRPQPRTVVVQQARPVTASSAAAGIEKRLHEQRKRLADARQRQQEAKQQARKILQRSGIRRQQMLKEKADTGAVPASALAGPGRLRRDLLAGLRDPNSLRKAVLYREILDPPLGMR
jgi:hypothetical protein